MKNRMNEIKIKDAINDLSIVDALLKKGNKNAARAELETLSEYVADIYGGSTEVRAAMDKWGREFCKRYVEAYKN